jgi:hypothetical protein
VQSLLSVPCDLSANCQKFTASEDLRKTANMLRDWVSHGVVEMAARACY